jgi:nucleoside-diphosphate-sugar epimerase
LDESGSRLFCVANSPMPTLYHLVIGTDHPFTGALTAALHRTYGEGAVQTAEDAATLTSLGLRYEIGCIYLLSGIFPSVTTEHPTATWHRSVRELIAVLDFARAAQMRVFWPSTIAVFGPSAPTEQCPIDAPQETSSFFAIAKRAGEQWCRQYHQEHGVDVRCLRFPVLIRPAPTTALLEQTPKIISEQRRPVLHVEDAVRATLELMFAPPEAVRERIYHVTGTSISVAELLTEIQFHHAAAGSRFGISPSIPVQKVSTIPRPAPIGAGNPATICSSSSKISYKHAERHG